jgi:hypothetical protein
MTVQGVTAGWLSSASNVNATSVEDKRRLGNGHEGPLGYGSRRRLQPSEVRDPLAGRYSQDTVDCGTGHLPGVGS